MRQRTIPSSVIGVLIAAGIIAFIVILLWANTRSH
jgi:hypothetical protein